MTATITESAVERQRQLEHLFCGAVLIDSDIVKRYGWVDENIFLDVTAKNFWTTCKTGAAPHEAALKSGDYVTLIGWMNACTSSSYAGQYADGIYEENYLVTSALKLSDVARLIASNDVNAVRAMIKNMADESVGSRVEVKTAVDVGLEFAELIESESIAISTGLPKFDQAIGGWEKKRLSVLAARTSMGKTTLAWQFARNVAASGKRVLYVSMEMSRTALWSKAACGACELSWHDITAKRPSGISSERLKTMKQEEKDRVHEQQKKRLYEENTNLMTKYGANMHIEDGAMQNLDSIWRITSATEPDLVIVDTLQHVKEHHENESLRLGRSIYGLSAMAKELNTHVLVVHQINREVENKMDKRPTLSDLRWSGDIEQAADIIMLMYREDYYKQDAAPGRYSKTEVIIGKNRDASRNTVIMLNYDLLRQWFYEL